MKKYCMIFTWLFIITMHLDANIIYVDNSNDSGIEDGTLLHPFNTIEEAMTAAPAGDTIFVFNGLYHPPKDTCYIKPGISLQGESAENTIINGDVKFKAASDTSIHITNLKFNDFIYWRTTIINGNFISPNIIKNCKCRNILIGHGAGVINDTTLGPIPYFHIEGNIVEEDITYGHGAGLIVGENQIINNIAENIGFKHGAIDLTQNQPQPEYSHLIENNVVNNEIIFSCGASPMMNTKFIARNNKTGIISIKSGMGHTYLITNNQIQNGISDASGACWTTIARNEIINGGIVDKSGGPDTLENEFIEENIIYFDENGYLFDDYESAVISVSSQSVTIRNNKITGKGRISGIIAKSGAPTNIIGNTIKIDIVDTIFPIEDYEFTAGIDTKAGAGIVTNNIIEGGYLGYYSKSGATLFENNTITKAHHGFYSKGGEAVKNNTISNCSGDGMILAGLRGPISGNIVRDNDSAGVRIIYPVDMGGGPDTCIGRNIFRNNGYYDMVIEYNPQLTTTLYIQNNAWDHETLEEILQYDIFNKGGSPNIIIDPSGFILKPEPTDHLFPINGYTEESENVQLIWRKSERAESYCLQVSLDSDFSNVILDTTGLADTTFVFTRNENSVYYWRVSCNNLAGISAWGDVWSFIISQSTQVNIEKLLPKEFILEQNFPNPFNPSTTINYELPKSCFVTLKIFNSLGQEIASLVDEYQNAGFHSSLYTLNSSLPSGIYFYQLNADGFISINKMIALK